ncbi:MAG: DNA polymerase III subunit gamma/tau [Alphaproteobacteria bacterium]|nr:DNA polymerase III subunit gamma/tau [Alphaproteobacteria bacterium]PPR14715.1 MAG: DNA polymerase III subunit tau [Alphaproteobacteria bacterium MarineAlpha12_Bin1]|tara:strand:- start:4582 stop:6597 length:2016 start_codon:yes stop_codon:yes gene_type:complete
MTSDSKEFKLENTQSVHSDESEGDGYTSTPTIEDVNQPSFLGPTEQIDNELNDSEKLDIEDSYPQKNTADKQNNNPDDYVVLARKYRPKNFSELIGQDSLVQTLTNAFKLDRVAHAFILTGVRGVGKTTTARIIAKCLNASEGPTATPKDDDEQCVAIAQDRHPDVIEVDAASRTGVDDIREILDGVKYRPVFGRYKVYIIDEVHMLSRNAFNALLKTLEEPPDHVKFVFATTEVRKVPLTVLSRCQRFDLRRVSEDQLFKYFSKIINKETVNIDDGALRVICRSADGSVRDGLSLLDQTISAHCSSGQIASEFDVSNMLGLVDKSALYDIFEATMSGKTNEALSTLNAIYISGADPLLILQDLLNLSHWLTKLKIVSGTTESSSVSEIDRVRGKELAENLSISVLSRSWQILLKGLDEVQNSHNSLSALEMVLIRLAYSADLPTPAEIISRLKEANEEKDQVDKLSKVVENNIEKSQTTVILENSEQSTNNKQVSNMSPGDKLGGGAKAALDFDLLPQAEDLQKSDPMSFIDLISLFAEKREVQISNHLYMNVHLVEYAPGHLEIRPNESAPANLAGEILNRLREWKGNHWIVSVSDVKGDPTLFEQDANKDQVEKMAAEQDPVVKAALKTFTGSRIERVLSRIENKLSDPSYEDNLLEIEDDDLFNEEK